MDFAHYWFGGGGANPIPFPVANSLRFRGSQWLYRNLSTPTSTTRGSWSFWFKRGRMNMGWKTFQCLMGCADVWRFAYDPGSGHQHDDLMYSGSLTNGWSSKEKYMDPSGWYHHLLVFDTSNSNASDRLILYMNGIRREVRNGGNPGQNANKQFGTAQLHVIGAQQGRSSNEAFDGYMAEFHHVDGQALQPTDFGEFNADGVWVPIQPSISAYGNNGFYLDFSDPNNIGADRSGRGNNFTADNFTLSDTSSTNYDPMEDSPTNNHGVLNSVAAFAGQDIPTITAGNLNFSHSSQSAYATVSNTWLVPRDGQYYVEWQINNASNITHQIRMRDRSGNEWLWAHGSGTSEIQYNGSILTYPGSTGDNTVCAIRFDNGTIRMYRGNTNFYNFSQTYASELEILWFESWSNGVNVNCGQKPFRYGLPGGYVPLSSVGASEVAVRNSSDSFQTFTSGGGTIVSEALSRFPHGLWYFKSYTNQQDHWWRDSLNGDSKCWHTPGTDVRAMETISGSGVAAGWSTNAAGLNREAGFQMITYSGNSSARTISHDLGAVPAMMWIKCTNASHNTIVYHKNLNANQFLGLNNGNQPQTDNNKWNNTRPTASVFSLGSNNEVNETGRTYVAYLWAEVPGYSSFGRYNGNNNSNGVSLNLGFRPRILCTKQINGNNGWFWRNASLNIYNPVTNITVFNENAYQQRDYVDFLANGWKARCGGGVTDGSGTNTGEYVYFAFAEHPFGGGNVAPSPGR